MGSEESEVFEREEDGRREVGIVRERRRTARRGHRAAVRCWSDKWATDGVKNTAAGHSHFKQGK